MRLKGKCAVVTGAGRGIGLAVARRFADEGAAVVIAERDREAGRAAAASITAAGGRALAVETDVGEAASVTAMVEVAVAGFGRIDVLVNNAGVAGNTPFLDIPLEEWERTLRINLTGAFLVAQATARRMVASGGGTIVNIVSISGQRGGDGRAAYGSAKAGLELLTKVMAVELAPHGIRVNAIAPGPIETEMARLAHDARSRAVYGYLTPMGRYGRPEEIAEAALFLACPESSYVTGHILNVDGGFGGAGLMYRRWPFEADKPTADTAAAG